MIITLVKTRVIRLIMTSASSFRVIMINTSSNRGN